MVAMNGLEKFSHLEDKIYRTIELTKALRQEKEDLERELVTLRSRDGARDELVAENERLLAEREAIRAKVQRILKKIDAVDPELAEAISG
jgi:FtsZ-binding cell division protein ZapB